MKKEEILIGCHVEFKSPDYFIGALNQAESFNSTVTSFYTGAPQNKRRTSVDKLKIKEGISKLSNSKIKSIIIHAPYIINLATPNDELRKYSIDFILSEMKRVDKLESRILVVHPGNYLTETPKIGIENLAKSLNYIFKNDKSDVKIAIETMAGKGTEIGINFDEISEIISLVDNKDRVGVCLDTCHTFDAGYNWNENVNSIIDDFNETIGINKLLVIHINNSKNKLGSRKDRHENILEGEINPLKLREIVWSKRLIFVPKILETPYVDSEPIYKKEIEYLIKK